MKIQLTPINIVIACVLAYYISEWGEDRMTFSWWWLILWTFVLLVIDLLFRLIFKDSKRIWFLQLAFVIIVGMLMVLIKLSLN
ncbi:hypothetical protein [Sphingobacterium hungaricum]|uniref:Uncharacterized protein n=1 Tax=Sphingobacterium hungaricum TaxID=2082723 RepID=A0A928UU44_9SPHI|nr:hypothetical protein [Sphingobacterium hungaricum]MBE8713260.1 hypothetical protein [Sphingobacterium hungaricum]